MKCSKRIARFALFMIAISMIAAPLTGWSIFAQAAVLAGGLILAAIIKRPTQQAITLAIFYAGCIFLSALIESIGGSKVLSVWLYGGLISTFWLQIQSKGRRRCWY